MDLKSGYPFWAVRNGLMHAFPPLTADLRCDVAVVGGGITGALIAHEFAAHGHAVAVFEERDIGWGSTAASTALLQYEIDTPMTDLARRLGEADALRAYRACVEAIGLLQASAGTVRDAGFRRMASLYYASRPRHRRALEAEYVLRRRHGFDVRWLGPGALRERFGFDAPGAILSRPAGVVDPYRLTYRLLLRAQRHGAQVFDRTRIAGLRATARGVELRDDAGQLVRARHAVLATGYATEHWLRKRVARNRSTYAFVTDPIAADALGPLRDTMAWETARPYLYLRTTPDGRLLAGGEDDSVDVPARRDKRVEEKARALVRKVAALFPHLPLEPVFSWAGTFAETADGLPFFGPHPERGPRVHFAMAYGGNGIVFSMLGAGLLRARVERRRHPLAALFSFARLDR